MTKLKLPAPNFDASKNTAEEINSSVFLNPFREAENAKEAILQKHVKMVEAKDNVIVINGKKICWNYRKGRCRFGHNCKFAHDSDVQKSKDQIDAERSAAMQPTVVCQNTQIGLQIPQTDIEKNEDEPPISNMKRKRPGLTQGLVPGKRVMKQYLKNQKI